MGGDPGAAEDGAEEGEHHLVGLVVALRRLVRVRVRARARARARARVSPEPYPYPYPS